MTRQMRFRHSINKAKDALFEPEQVTHKENNSEPKERVEGALDEHIKNAISNAPESLGLNRTDHFELGQQESKIISMGKFKEDKANKELMDKNNE